MIADSKWLKAIVLALTLSLSSASAAEYSDKIKKQCEKEGPRSEICQDIKMQQKIGKYWQEMKDFYFLFKHAVIQDDKETIAKMAEYPFSVFYRDDTRKPDNFGRRVNKRIIKNEQEFIENYDSIITKDMKWEIIGNSRYERLLIGSSFIESIIGYGNVTFVENCKYKRINSDKCPIIKITSINNDIEKNNEGEK